MKHLEWFNNRRLLGSWKWPFSKLPRTSTTINGHRSMQKCQSALLPFKIQSLKGPGIAWIGDGMWTIKELYFASKYAKTTKQETWIIHIRMTKGKQDFSEYMLVHTRKRWDMIGEWIVPSYFSFCIIIINIYHHYSHILIFLKANILTTENHEINPWRNWVSVKR